MRLVRIPERATGYVPEWGVPRGTLPTPEKNAFALEPASRMRGQPDTDVTIDSHFHPCWNLGKLGWGWLLTLVYYRDWEEARHFSPVYFLDQPFPTGAPGSLMPFALKRKGTLVKEAIFHSNVFWVIMVGIVGESEAWIHTESKGQGF